MISYSYPGALASRPALHQDRIGHEDNADQADVDSDNCDEKAKIPSPP